MKLINKRMDLPMDMSERGTMLVDGKSCPTHHVEDRTIGFRVSTGDQFWGRVLGVLSSTRSNGSTQTDQCVGKLTLIRWLWSVVDASSSLGFAAIVLIRVVMVSAVGIEPTTY